MKFKNVNTYSRNKLLPNENINNKNSLSGLMKKGNTAYSTISILNWDKKENDEKDRHFFYHKNNNIQTVKLMRHNKSTSIEHNKSNIKKFNLKKSSLNKTITRCKNSGSNKNSCELVKYMKQILKTKGQTNKNIINKIEQITIKDFINSRNISNKNSKCMNMTYIGNRKNKIKNLKMNIKLTNCISYYIKQAKNFSSNNKNKLKSKNLKRQHSNKLNKKVIANKDDSKIECIKKENEKIRKNIEEENKKGKMYINKIMELKNKNIYLNKRIHKLKNDNKIYSNTLEKLLTLIELLNENGLDISHIIDNMSFFESEETSIDEPKNDNNKKHTNKDNNNTKYDTTLSYGKLEIHKEFLGSKVPPKITNQIPKLNFH